MVQRITISPQQYQAADGSITLQPDQLHYLLRVLRLKAGDRFIAQNGQGQQWLAAIVDHSNQVKVLEAIASQQLSTPPIRLIAALPKGNSFDQVVRQTTELGVTHIHPVISDRTLLKPSPGKLSRWRRIAQEASEQSERITVPEVYEPVSFQQVIKHPPWEVERSPHSSESSEPILCLCAARQQTFQSGDKAESSSPTNGTAHPHLLTYLLAHQSANSASMNLLSIILAIGPEGGWTDEEIAVAIASGYKSVSLGSVILRAVTAPIAALSLITAAREVLI